MLEHLAGLVKVRVMRGVREPYHPRPPLQRPRHTSSAAWPSSNSSQKLKTRVVRKSTNPEWNDELTLCIDDPAVPLQLDVFDKDTFCDDPMGNAELDIGPLVEVVKMRLQGIPDKIVVTKLVPNRQNCLAKESAIYVSEGTVKKDVVVRLRNVECGEIELQLQWIDIPGSKGV